MDILILADGTQYEMKDQSSISHIGINLTWSQLPDVISKFCTTNLTSIQIMTNDNVSANYSNLALKSMTPPDVTGYAYFELVDAEKKTTGELMDALKEAQNQAAAAKNAQMEAETAKTKAEADKVIAETAKTKALSDKEAAEAERASAISAKADAEAEKQAAQQQAAFYEDGYKAAKYLMGEEE